MQRRAPVLRPSSWSLSDSTRDARMKLQPASLRQGGSMNASGRSFVRRAVAAGAILGLLRAPAAVAAPGVDTVASPGPGIDLAGLDRSVPPGDDFFAHANGTWL